MGKISKIGIAVVFCVCFGLIKNSYADILITKDGLEIEGIITPSKKNKKFRISALSGEIYDDDFTVEITSAGVKKSYFKSDIIMTGKTKEEAYFELAIKTCLMISGSCKYMTAGNYDVYPPDLKKLCADDMPFFGPYLKSKICVQEPFFGYIFNYKSLDGKHFEIVAKPIEPNFKTIFVDETGVFRLDNKQGALIKVKKEITDGEWKLF